VHLLERKEFIEFEKFLLLKFEYGFIITDSLFKIKRMLHRSLQQNRKGSGISHQH
jgi:hypothetical protein